MTAGVETPPKGMPALTLHQPWATLVVRGWKVTELRSHWRLRKSLEGERFAIHAAGIKSWDEAGAQMARRYLVHGGPGPHGMDALFESARMQCGHILGTVRCYGVRGMAQGDKGAALHDWDHKLVAYLLEEAERFDWPIPAKGQQGVWYPSKQGVVLPGTAGGEDR